MVIIMLDGVVWHVLGACGDETINRIADKILLIKNNIEESNRIKSEINRQLAIEREKFISRNDKINFDFDAIPNVILGTVFNKVTISNLLSIDKNRVDREIDSICNKCKRRSYSKDDASSIAIRQIVVHCLQVVDECLYSLIPKETLLLAQKCVDAINVNTNKVITEEISQLNLRFAEYEERTLKHLNEISEKVDSIDNSLSQTVKIDSSSTEELSVFNEQQEGQDCDNSRRTMIINNPDGTSEECEVLLAFEFKDTKKEYVIYTKNERDWEDSVTVYISYVDRSSGSPVLQNIDDEDEWKRLLEVVKKLSDSPFDIDNPTYSYDGKELL